MSINFKRTNYILFFCILNQINIYDFNVYKFSVQALMKQYKILFFLECYHVYIKVNKKNSN